MNRSTGSPGDNAASFRVGQWVALPARDLLVRGDEQVKIEPRTMEVLRRLAREPGAVVAQAELEADVWPGLIVTSQSVYQAIAQLRRVLGDNPREPQYIETVPRRGYRLVAPVAPFATVAPESNGTDQTPASAALPHDPESPSMAAPAARPDGRVRRSRVALVTVLGALALLIAAGAGYRLQWQEQRGSSIAVLAFDDLSPERSEAYLANLLVEEITSALGQVHGLKVAGRDSARAARVDGGSMANVGESLGVDHVLRGSVRRVGDRVRVVAVLVETETGYEKWSRTFERPAASVARLPADIAGAAAGAVGLALVGDPGVRGSRVGTKNPTAYDYYMLGQQRFAERTSFALTEAQRYFQQAIEADPGFAAAYAALADVYVAEFYFANRQLSETLDLMRPLVDEALEIDPAFGFAHALLGWTELERGDFTKARTDLAKAIELSPNDAKARMWLGSALLADARPREALDELERALELDPLNFILHIRHALVLDALGRHDAAVESATRAVTLAPRHPNPRWTLALIATSRGDLPLAIAHYEAALSLDPARSDLRIQLATLLLDAGRDPDARQQLSEAARLAQSSHMYLTAQAYAALLAGEQRQLMSIAESLASIDPRNRYLVLDAANFMALAGEHAKAIELFDVARAENPDSVLNDLWMIRWGLETGPSCLAWSYLQTGRTGDGRQIAARVERFLAEAQQRGVRYWGLAYQRAALAALQGDTRNALARLEEAAAAGWRRTWWARTDPALANLRTLPEFGLLLDRLEGSQR
jgi:DNA-binding winged helix-turn-helix (wHTH) protein/TolB-like protein/Tfp pilus assembly protein PilF